MSLWRLHIRPKRGDGDSRLSTQFCLDRSIVGMGWAISDRNEPSGRSQDWDWYRSKAEAWYRDDKSWSSVRKLAIEVRDGDLLWFRQVDGVYYLAEIIGPWQYAHEGDHIAPDIVNFRPARITKVGFADAVPGAICSAFRPPRTLQPITTSGMLEYSEALSGRTNKSLRGTDLLSFLAAEDIENIVAVYLQTCGWILIPTTRRVDTPHYEYVFVNAQSGERAIAQVKSGSTSIDASRFAQGGRVFLFAASGDYGVSVPDNAKLISRAALEGLIRDRPALLPDAIKTWIGVIGWA